MYIYKITNKINEKSYIGQTTRSIKERWKRHCEKVSRCSAINKAIQKYGKDNFTIEEIGGANNQSELNYQEWLMIFKHNTLSPNGYNLREGGRSGGKMTSEIKNKLSKALKGRVSPYKGKKHTEQSKVNMSLGSIGQKGWPIGKSHKVESNLKNSITNGGGKSFIVTNSDNKMIWSGVIISQCARFLNLNVGHVSEYLRGKRKMHKDYTFSYEVLNGR